jgi:hypothetical protein
MAVNFTQYPLYPVPGRPARIGITVGVGNYARLYMTDAPQKSAWYAKIKAQAALRVLAHQGDARTPWDFTPDASGKYVFKAQDITKGAAFYGGRQLGDPAGFNSETINGGESSLTIIVGSQLDMPCGAGKDRGTIRLWMFGDTCRATTVEMHGEATPAIIKARTPRLEKAARVAAVTLALENLVNQTSTTLVGSTGVDTILDNCIAQIYAHEQDAGPVWHNAFDHNNQTTTGYQSANNPERMQRAVTQALSNFDAHMRNDNGGGTGSAQYHILAAAPGGAITDWSDALLWTAVGSQAECVIGVVDLWRAYEKHRTRWNAAPSGEDVHKSIVGMPTLTALPANSIFLVHFALLTELAKTDPSGSAPATSNPGAERLAAELGAIET